MNTDTSRVKPKTGRVCDKSGHGYEGPDAAEPQAATGTGGAAAAAEAAAAAIAQTAAA